VRTKERLELLNNVLAVDQEDSSPWVLVQFPLFRIPKGVTGGVGVLILLVEKERKKMNDVE